MVVLSLILSVLTTLTPGSIEAYQYSGSLQRSPFYNVTVEGKDIAVLPTEQAQVAQFGADGEVLVNILYKAAELRTADIRPLGKGYEYEIEGQVLRLKLKTFDRVSVEINGDTAHPLFIFVNPPEKEKALKAKENKRTLFFEAGSVYQVKKISLKDYDGMYIEGGAFVRAVVTATELDGLVIDGCGVLDCRAEEGNGARFSNCNNLTINNLCILNRGMVGCQFVNCSSLAMSNVKILNVKTQSITSEKAAISWAGCSKVSAEKLFSYSQQTAYSLGNKYFDKVYPCGKITLTDCIGWNVQTGNTLNISCSGDCPVSDVKVDRFYAIHSAGSPKPYYRSVIKISQKGEEKVSNLSFTDIDIEDPGEYLIYLSGWICDSEFKNIRSRKKAPFGSLLRGMSAERRVENIHFENFIIEKQRVNSLKKAGFVNPTLGLNVIVK